MCRAFSSKKFNQNGIFYIMTPLDVQRIFNAIRLHFYTDTYCAVKYNFKTQSQPKDINR